MNVPIFLMSHKLYLYLYSFSQFSSVAPLCLTKFFSEEKGLGQLALPRVTRMDESGDGGVEFDFDAAIPPAVELGQYLGLEVYVPSDESPDLHVLRAAAERMNVEIPETYISRKIDGLMRQRL